MALGRFSRLMAFPRTRSKQTHLTCSGLWPSVWDVDTGHRFWPLLISPNQRQTLIMASLGRCTSVHRRAAELSSNCQSCLMADL